MPKHVTHEREMLLIEILQAGLDLREKAAAADAPALVHLANMLARRAHAELEAVGMPGAAADRLDN